MLLPSLVLLVALAQAQPTPATPANRPPAATDPATFTARTLSDAEATQALADFKAVPAKASLADRLAAIEALVRGSHANLVPVLDRTVRRDGAMVVRKKAAEALGWQPAKKAYPVVVALLESTEVCNDSELVAPLVTALARVGYASKDWQRLETLFRAGYGPERTGLQRAIIQLAATQKEKLAVPVLLENLDEPLPVDVHGASNPPAEYWEARWKAWRAWRDDVRNALMQITGQKFASAEEAQAWLRINGAKLGIKKF